MSGSTPRKTRKATRTYSTIHHKLESIESSIQNLYSLVQERCTQIPAPREEEIAIVPVAASAAAPAAAMPKVTASASAPTAVAKKRPGPQLWNEFLKNYMRNQESKGRKISRAEAMREAGVNYRAKYGLPTPKSRKKAKNQPVITNVSNVSNVPNAANAVVPGSLVTLTPGRGTPVKSANAPSAFQNVLNTLTGTASAPASAPSANAKANAKTNTTPAAEQPPNNPSNTNTNANTNATRPSPATYGYQDLGMAANNSARKVIVDGDEYFMTDNDRALFRRMGDDLGDWVGYLEPGGTIRYTESPNA
jgi:hypothetical protein